MTNGALQKMHLATATIELIAATLALVLTLRRLSAPAAAPLAIVSGSLIIQGAHHAIEWLTGSKK